MSRLEIKRKFDEIVAFAEIETFLDTPVKRYSSGMYVRLAFAVAAHLEPESWWWTKCSPSLTPSFKGSALGRISTVAHGGRTVLFVSHNMGVVSGLCQRIMWLEHGQVLKTDVAESRSCPISAAWGTSYTC